MIEEYVLSSLIISVDKGGMTLIEGRVVQIIKINNIVRDVIQDLI